MAPHPHQIATPAAYLLASLALFGGIRGFADPVAFSKTFGVTLATPDSPGVPFVVGLASRNVASGITLLALLGTGQRRAAGAALMAGVVATEADAWICSTYAPAEGVAVGHAVMGIVVGAVGAVLYFY